MPRSLSLDDRAARRSSRWRRLNRTLSVGVGALAVGSGIYLGVTGPSTSPVQSAAAPATTTAPAAPATGTGAGTAGGTADVPVDGGRGRGFDGGGDRTRMAGFGGHHR